MDKNQWVVIMIVGAFVVIGIFMYTILRTDKYDIDEELQGVDNEYLFNIDEEISDDEENKIVVGQEIDKKDIVENLGVQTSESGSESINVNENSSVEQSQAINNSNSPETGPGSIAAVLAIVFAAIVSWVVYKKQDKKNSV